MMGAVEGDGNGVTVAAGAALTGGFGKYNGPGWPQPASKPRVPQVATI